MRPAVAGQVGDDGLQERVVVWHTEQRREEFIFTGGIILVANRRLDDSPQARAINSRIPVLLFQPTNEEIAALMRHIASQGHRHGPYTLSAEDCQEVAEEIIARSSRLQRNLDLRLLVNAFQDRLQFINGDSESDWRHLLDSRIKGRVTAPAGGYQSRSDRKDSELAIVREIAHLGRQERLAAWQKATHKSEKALYRRLKELGQDGSHSPQFAQGGDWRDN
jgi:hypothetical protein